MTLRPGDDDDRPRDTRGPGWLRDEAGRPYREEKGTRVYQRGEDRDAALDDTYRLSDSMRAALELDTNHPRGVATLVMANATELVELFWREARTLSGRGTAQKLDEWSVRHFGRVLEPGARGLLLFEARSREEYAGNRRTLALYASYGEQRRFEESVRTCGPRGESEGSLGYVERICRESGVDLGPGPRQMPHAPGRREWERRQNEQKAAALAYREPGEDDE